MIRRAVIGLILFSFMTIPVSAQETVTGRASVVDGDTIDISDTRIPLDGIDAPESWQKCRRADGSEYRCGAGWQLQEEK
ncbi:thermonuclease family protein [Rhizobium leguminosarum]|uniref:thermonuclease family protein n=1 Tax=Rhizobium leguminosarum TaxID=384 RepID=UPI003F97BE05